ncbi:transcriptional regulator [Bifidobacterium ramosum]|uniref:Transcriptional regulator n=1 Tax=Bifidobacterium ramosum TaxID=1798158 RepID=A0A6L4X067_9BIFI|nr:LCP family protein [Bifidobacterium ramosum]KAB8287495.1 transcriptional regulator [Bifidobacterium ramosum]NEG72215.1 transcriptional regulator [Bifidobacterium ramosum]
MGEGHDGMTPATPPSFTPAGSRRRSSQTPRREEPAAPPSFTPHAGAAGQASGNGGDAVARPAAATPQSFAPTVPRQPRRSGNAAPHAASSSSSQARPSAAHAIPQSIPPQSIRPQSVMPQAVGRTAGTTRPTGRPTSGMNGMNRTNHHTTNAGGTAAATATAARTMGAGRRRHHPLRIVLGALILLVVLLALGVFGGWNWVTGNLTRSDWLTDAKDKSGATSWLLVGSDKRDGTEGVAGADDGTVTGFRTDTLLVLTKPKSGASSLISIPRDSLVEIDGQYLKINAVAQIYGNKALVGEVEQITGQKIDHVAEIQFGGLKNVVDAIGGVELCYDQDVDDGYSGLKWTKGCHMADGTTALAFSRMRYSDAQGDFGRAARQRQVIGAVMKKALSASTLTNPGKIGKLASASLAAVGADEDTSPYTLLTMALAFRDATGSNGVNGSLYWSDPDYYVDGVGSSVLLDNDKNTALFEKLSTGTQPAGEVGTLAES